MAYFEKTKTGKHRAHIDKLGVRESETFDTKRAAQEWATKREAEILDGSRGKFPRKTLGEVLDIYVKRVSSKKEGARWEELRVEAFKRNFPKLAAKVMSETTTADWSEWRDARMAKVSGSTVQREINLWSAVYHAAMHELGPYVGASPLTQLEKPKENPARTATWGWSTTKQVLRRLGYATGRAPLTKSQELAYALLVALRTSMRIQEVLSLSGENVNLQTRVATVGHKMQYVTGEPRRVPMQRQVVRLLVVLASRGLPGGRFFSTTPGRASALWGKYRAQLLIENLTIHDTRGTAITRLSRQVDVLTLSRITGIKDLRLLNERYYRERDEEIAARL